MRDRLRRLPPIAGEHGHAQSVGREAPNDGCGVVAKTIGDRYPEFSPAHNVSRDDPPAVLFLGSKDNLIPVATLETLKTRMNAAGVTCELHVYEGQGHGFFNTKNRKYFQLTVIAADKFLASLGWLKGPPTLTTTDSE